MLAWTTTLSVGPRGAAAPQVIAPPLAALALLGVLFVVLLVVLWLVFARLRKYAQQSDAAALPLGLVGRRHFRGRAYDGTHAGRSVHLWVLPPRRYSTSLLGVTIGARTRGKASVSPSSGGSALGDLLMGESFPLGPGLGAHSGRADDPSRLHALLALPGLRERVQRIAGDGHVTSYLLFRPGHVEVRAMGMVYADWLGSEGALRARLDDLAIIAEAAERVGL